MGAADFGSISSPFAPTNPRPSQHWYDTTTDLLKRWNGTSWVVGSPRVSGNRVAFTGDSITVANCDMTVPSWGDSWTTSLCLSSNGALQPIYNAGHGGYTSTQLLALFDTEILAYSPTLVGILAGTNDTLDGSNQPTATKANIKAMVSKARAAGADVFLATIPPAGMAALSAPAAPAPSVVATGGTLVAATYRYVVTGVNGVGETTASSVGSVVVGSGTTNSINVDFTHLEGTMSYKIYKETTPGSGVYGLIGTNSFSGQGFPAKRFVDTGAVSPAAAPPGSNTTAAAWNATSQLKLNTINSWLRRYASANAIPLVDFHSILVDPTTGLYKTGYTHDGTHPTATRQKMMGVFAWATLASQIRPVTPPITHDNADPLNLYANGCLINGSANLPTSWSSYGGVSSGFTDTLGVKTGFLGKALTIARSVPDVRFHDSPSVTAGFVDGDRIIYSFIMQIENSEAGGGGISFSIRTTGSNTNVGNVFLNASDIGPCLWTNEFTVPVGTTGFYIKGPYASYGPCQGSIGQITFYNATAGGFLIP